jgi:hypothetical protein
MRVRRANLVGLKIGLLTVLSKFDITDYGSVRWLCQCACGNKTVVKTCHLKAKVTRSCGCLLRKSRSMPDSAYRYYFRQYKFSAKNRNLPFELSFLQCKRLFQKPCYYCGVKNSNRPKYGINDKKGTPCNGIDRLNNKKGYIRNNVVTCCKKCNWLKKNLSKTVFINQVKRIYLHLNGQ